MVNSKQDVFRLIEENREKIKLLGVKKVGLFGSFARNQNTKNSDVDMLIEFIPGHKNYRNFLGFAQMAEQMFGREVELLTPEALSPFLAPHIQKEVEYVQIT